MKYYVNEPDAAVARELIDPRRTSPLRFGTGPGIEVTCVYRRLVREGFFTPEQGRAATDLFGEHIELGLWNLVPISESLIRTTLLLLRSLPPEVPLGDAIHLATAISVGAGEIWTTDRHLLAAASHAGLVGRRV